LRGQAGVRDLDPQLDGVLRIVGAKELGIGVTLSHVTDTIKDGLSTPIPELAMIKDRVDHGRAVTGLDTPRVHRSHAKAERVRSVREEMNSLRRNDVIAVSRSIECSPQPRNGETSKRKVARFELMVWPRTGRKSKVRIGYVL